MYNLFIINKTLVSKCGWTAEQIRSRIDQLTTLQRSAVNALPFTRLSW